MTGVLNDYWHASLVCETQRSLDVGDLLYLDIIIRYGTLVAIVRWCLPSTEEVESQYMSGFQAIYLADE